MSGTLRDIGELCLLATLAPMLERHARGLPLGTGDDVAITPPESAHRLVWTLDTMVEGTHFRWYEHPLATPEAVAHKLVATNVSDLASKGATPVYALLSVGAPPTTPIDRMQRFYAGLDTALTRYGVRLIGGDTVRSPQWVLSLALIGSLDAQAHIAARSGARTGQCLYITGSPGEAGAGLEILEGGLRIGEPHNTVLVSRSVMPEARLAAGRALVSAFDDLAMLDVSDGVATDAARIASLSGAAVVIEEAQLPISEALRNTSSPAKSPAGYVLFGGEDYELLFATAAREDDVRRVITTADPGLPVTRIGRIEAGSGIWLDSGGGKNPLDYKGFQHFTV